MKKSSTILWIPLLFALALGACRDSTIYPDHNNNGGNNPKDSTTLSIDDLLGAEWRLVGFQRQNGNSVQLDKVPDNQTFTLTFGTGDASGMADCKGYAYQYSHTDEGKLSFFNPAPQIALVCPSGSYDAKFYNAIETAVAYKATNATLYIYYGDDAGDRDRALYFVRKDQQGGGDSEPIVLYRLEEIRLKSSDPYKVLNASISGDRLDLNVQYSGGCEQHDFTLMGPLTIATGGADLNSGTGTPVNVYLYHDAKGDACEALITEDIKFDLTPLKERWKEVTGRTDGLIRLTINDLHSGDIWTLYYQIGNGGGVPNWLQDTIAAIKSRPAANPPESFWRYTYQGEVVYYRPPICCDMFSVLYDEEGNVICSPDGGIAGHGDGRCPDFGTAAGNRKLVWQDPR